MDHGTDSGSIGSFSGPEVLSEETMNRFPPSPFLQNLAPPVQDTTLSPCVFGETTLIGIQTAISPVVEVRVCRTKSTDGPSTRRPLKIAACASAPRMSPTEVDARIACLGLWRYRLGRY